MYLSAILTYIQQWIMVGVTQKIVFNLRRDISEKLTRVPLSFFDARSHGDTMSRATNDVDTISSTMQQSLTQLITSVVTLIGIIIMMLTISPLLDTGHHRYLAAQYFRNENDCFPFSEIF